jgi:hypothetical protein
MLQVNNKRPGQSGKRSPASPPQRPAGIEFGSKYAVLPDLKRRRIGADPGSRP